ncbi:hypothetical protein GcC1_135016 [Golovinomyces cichoracearum]|uniref:Uncharacterized protein n=1 Tax=Golovinomyces cichoracearum TaxID=62708 RepID=A0A420I2V8_9PEZI|nr:hypothetical protein GcC1_135016 [Golovinomyces cichoracearum]
MPRKTGYEPGAAPPSPAPSDVPPPAGVNPAVSNFSCCCQGCLGVSSTGQDSFRSSKLRFFYAG